MLVHCEVNFRDSVFSFLYQVLYEGADADKAISLIDSTHVPNGTLEAVNISMVGYKRAFYQPL